MTEPNTDINEWRGVWVYAEQWGGNLQVVAAELLGEGRRLADKLGVDLSAVLLGHGVRPLADDLISHGADRVYVGDDPRLENFECTAYAPTLVNIVRRHKPEILLLGSTPIGRSLAPRVAAALRTGLSADCIELDIDADRTLEQIVPAFGGKAMATIVTPEHRPQMATVRPGVMQALTPEPRDGSIIDIDVELQPDHHRVTILEISEDPGQESESLDEAETIVGGGVGITDSAGWDIMNQLAEALHGIVGGTRPAMDDGWIPEDRMIGQSGKTVRPRLYIAVGISGEAQHLVGIQGAQVIVAINNDPAAPMLSNADFGIVGDYREVLPPLIESIENAV